MDFLQHFNVFVTADCTVQVMLKWFQNHRTDILGWNSNAMPLYRNTLTGLKCNVISEGSSEWEFQRTKSLKLDFWELVMAKSVTCYERLSQNDCNAYLKLEKILQKIMKLWNLGELIGEIICRLSPTETYIQLMLRLDSQNYGKSWELFLNPGKPAHFWRFDRPFSGILTVHFRLKDRSMRPGTGRPFLEQGFIERLEKSDTASMMN